MCLTKPLLFFLSLIHTTVSKQAFRNAPKCSLPRDKKRYEKEESADKEKIRDFKGVHTNNPYIVSDTVICFFCLFFFAFFE